MLLIHELQINIFQNNAGDENLFVEMKYFKANFQFASFIQEMNLI